MKAPGGPCTSTACTPLTCTPPGRSLVLRCLKRWKRIALLLLLLAVAGIVAVVAIDRRISATAEGRIHADLNRVEEKPVALVLGTSREAFGRPNLFYVNRMEAAAALFHAGKVRGLIVSGDNSRRDYDEPGLMKADLVALGVPDAFITCDFAGFRTLDSIVRAREVFGRSSFVVVSQRFHCERALYIADDLGLDACAFVADDVSGAPGLRVRLREVFARAKAFLDVHLLGTKPRFLGAPEKVGLREDRASEKKP